MSKNTCSGIRLATLDDAPAILSIFQHCDLFATKGRRQQHVNLIDVIDWIDSITGAHPMLVCEKQGKVIAWCSLEPFYGLPAFDAASEISLYVHPEEQGKGVGTQLIQYLETQRTDLAFNHLIAYIYASNVESQGFFKRQGFEQWGLLPNIAQSEGVKENVLLFGKEFF